MTYTPINILQCNEYYAHGAPNARSWTRDNTTTNSFLANGGTELNTTSQLYDLEYRNYDPILGRMNGVDPMADKYGSLTPYNYSFNSPTMHNDVSGADPTDQTPYWIEESMQRNARRYKGEVIDTYNQFAGLMRTTPQKMFEERSAGGYTAWSPSSNSLMSYGGITGAEYSQMYDDARNLTPQEYGEKYGERISVGQGMILMAQYNMSVLANSTSAMLGLIRYIGMDVAEKAYGPGGINRAIGARTLFASLNNAAWMFQDETLIKLRSDFITVTFDKGADGNVNPKLAAYFALIMEKASEIGVASVNISSTTNHPSNRAKSAHNMWNGARAVDISVINGERVLSNNPCVSELQKIIQTTLGWLDNYGPSIIQQMSNGVAIEAPWAREIPGGHYDHIHISVPWD